MKIGSLYIQGLSNKLKNNDFVHIVNSHDIFIVTETWLLHDEIKNIKLDNYVSIHKTRKKSANAKCGSQGISMFYKNTLSKSISTIRSKQNWYYG